MLSGELGEGTEVSYMQKTEVEVRRTGSVKRQRASFGANGLRGDQTCAIGGVRQADKHVDVSGEANSDLKVRAFLSFPIHPVI